MGGFLSGLGNKLAEKWLSLLILPGALFLAVAATAHTLGHTHAFDLRMLTEQISRWAKAPAAGTIGGQVVLLGAVLGGAAAVGLAAQAIGSLIETVALAADWETWPHVARRLARWRTEVRQGRWETLARDWYFVRRAVAQAHVQGDPALIADRQSALAKTQAEMAGISLERPSRPTWTGDRIHASVMRAERDLDLDLAVVWPHLWLSMPETSRIEVTAARAGVNRCATLAAWALLYLPLAWWWWPAALVTTVVASASSHRLRGAVDVYATVLEATARHHIRDLASHLGFGTPGPVTPTLGDQLSRHLKPSPPPEPPPLPPPTGSHPSPPHAP
ncbi:hypothetical protein AB0H18_00520 [Streptomyces sp. NPDC020766]|uniref:hypothetical protein n=1 Tax=Streptomyces sp. NPDC020766 TaxID=3155011 RepID=UPI0033F99EE0